MKTNSIVSRFACALALSAVAMTAQEAVPAKAFPTDSGVYFQTPVGDWTDAEPEIVTWKTGGVAKSAFSYGIVKGDLNGHIKGGTSEYRMVSAGQVLVVVPEGTAIAEYQLLRLRNHSNSREFRAATGGIIHQSGGSDRDALDFEHKRVASRTYLITLAPSLKDGEYGLMPPGAEGSRSSTSIGKMYTFHIANE
ncbi:MAG: hypothetical protein M3Y57_06725 [Acidobacteriota bacterium]|nr:hypothetical protein [Acidobacteriota bacterium]